MSDGTRRDAERSVVWLRQLGRDTCNQPLASSDDVTISFGDAFDLANRIDALLAERACLLAIKDAAQALKHRWYDDPSSTVDDEVFALFSALSALPEDQTP